MEEKVIKSYKSFDKNMKECKIQYEVGKEYVMNEDSVDHYNGFLGYESPLDVLDYCNMLDSRFAKVEQYGKIVKEENSTRWSSKIKIKEELKLSDLIGIGIGWLEEVAPSLDANADNTLKYNGNDYANMSSSGESVNIGLRGDCAQIASSGDNAKILSCGRCTQIASSGKDAQIGSTNECANIASSSYCSKIFSSGYSAQIASSGGGTKIVSSGKDARIASSDSYVNISSSGDGAKITLSGGLSKVNSEGRHSVIMCADSDSKVKAKVGSWITLTEWGLSVEEHDYIPKCVKTEYVDGERIKADTWYQLINGEFVEATE